MNFTENAKSKFWADLSAGIKTALNKDIGEAFHIDQYKSGHIAFTESVVGGPGMVTTIMDKIKESSPAIKSVRMTPVSTGYNASYNVSVEFDPMVAESVYSNGKTALASIETNGKNYIVHNDGSATEVDDADKYVARLNKTTGANFKKEEEITSNDPLEDEDGFPVKLGTVIALANRALEGSGATVVMADNKIIMRGASELIKPTQKCLPEPCYGLDALEGGYNEDDGTMEVCVPECASDCDLEQIREFLIAAVNAVMDACESQGNEPCDDAEWCDAMAEAEPDESYASQYAYKGESFVGTDKHKAAVLVKSLMQENLDEARKVATKFMDKDMAEGFIRKYAPKQVVEKHEIIVPDEMAMLDRMHESAMSRAPEKSVDMDKLVEKNMNKENN